MPDLPFDKFNAIKAKAKGDEVAELKRDLNELQETVSELAQATGEAFETLRVALEDVTKKIHSLSIKVDIIDKAQNTTGGPPIQIGDNFNAKNQQNQIGDDNAQRWLKFQRQEPTGSSRKQ